MAEQARLYGRIAELRTLSARLGEDSARQHAESLQADDAAARHTAAEEQRSEAMRAVEAECAQLAEKVSMGEATFTEAETLAQTLGDKSVVLMRGHGDVTVGPSVKLAVFRAYYTDVNARLQSQALALGGEVNYLTPEEGAKADTINLIVLDRIWGLWKMRVAPTPAKWVRSRPRGSSPSSSPTSATSCARP